MKFTYVCLLALCGSTLAAKAKNMKAQGFLPTYDNGDKEINTNVNANVDPDFVGNLGVNTGLNVDKSNEKSHSHSEAYSESYHNDRQEISIHINFNVELPDHHHSCSDDY